MTIRVYSDGIRWAGFGVRWRRGVCSPERRVHVALFSVETPPGSLRLSVQAWRAFAWVEVIDERPARQRKERRR